MKQAIDHLMKFLSWTSGAAFLLLFVLTVVNIVLRYFVGTVWVWVPDFSSLLFIWVVFMGAAVTYARKGHLIMDFFVSKFGAERRERLYLIVRVAMIAFLAVLVVKGIGVTRVRMRIPYPVSNIPTGISYLALPVNAFFMILSDIEHIASSARNRRSHDEH